MKEDIITFETSMLAKEKGFNESIIYVFVGKKDMLIKHWDIIPGTVKYEHVYHAPTQSLLQKWLRDKHDIHCLITPYHDGLISYNYEILQPSNDFFYCSKEVFFKYNKALDDGLKEALKLIK